MIAKALFLNTTKADDVEIINLTALTGRHPTKYIGKLEPRPASQYMAIANM